MLQVCRVSLSFCLFLFNLLLSEYVCIVMLLYLISLGDIKKTQGCTYFGIATCCISLMHLFMKASMPRSVPDHIIENKTVPLCVQITPHYKELLGITKNIYLSLPVNICNVHEDAHSTSCYTCPDVARSHYEVVDSSGMSVNEIDSLRHSAKVIEAAISP